MIDISSARFFDPQIMRTRAWGFDSLYDIAERAGHVLILSNCETSVNGRARQEGNQKLRVADAYSIPGVGQI